MSIDKLSSIVPQSYSIDVNSTKRPVEMEVATEEKATNTKELSKEKLEEVVKGMNEFLQPTNTSLKFEMHEELQEYYVKIVDSKTMEVVREIPSKKILDFYAEMTKFVGLLVDKKI